MMRYTHLPIGSVVLFVMAELAVAQPCGWVRRIPDSFTGEGTYMYSTSGDPIGLDWVCETWPNADMARARVDATLNYSVWSNSKEISCGCSRQKRWEWMAPGDPDASTFEVQCTATIESAIGQVEASNNLCFGTAEEDSETSVSMSSFLNDANKTYACGSKKKAVLSSYYLPGPGSKDQSEQSISVTKGPEWIWNGLFKLITSDRAKADTAVGAEGSATTSLNFTNSKSLGTITPPVYRPRTVSSTHMLYARAYAMSYVCAPGESTESTGSAKIKTGTFTLEKYSSQ